MYTPAELHESRLEGHVEGTEGTYAHFKPIIDAKDATIVQLQEKIIALEKAQKLSRISFWNQLDVMKDERDEAIQELEIANDLINHIDDFNYEIDDKKELKLARISFWNQLDMMKDERDEAIQERDKAKAELEDEREAYAIEYKRKRED